MFNSEDQVIYVGKAKNLKRRVSSYFVRHHDHPKTRTMVAQVARVELMLTNTEAEAFILEYTLIKKHNPRYNIIFRDDKAYP
jgi:excinuclease ABC subunit C